MSAKPKVFGIVLAGGEGKRLMPLTEDRAKPAVPFGGGYRLIDFALSNLINAGMRQIVVLTQYKSHSLDRHVSQTWRLSGLLNAYVASVPAQQRLGPRWFSGSADAILQSLNLLRDERPDIVVVVGADHVYRMDFAQMIEAHIASGKGVTVAGIRQPISLANQFGVIDVAEDGVTIDRFLEKPDQVDGLPDDPTAILASMGNYVFNAKELMEAVTRDADVAGSRHDMGGDIIPAFVAERNAGVYDMQRNVVPGTNERDRFYWRDVGTIDSFFEAHQDLLAGEPTFNLYNRDWQIYSQQLNSPPAKFIIGDAGQEPVVVDSMISLGTVIAGARVERSVLGTWCRIESGARVADAVFFDQVTIGAGATVRRAILDKFVEVEPGASVGVDPELDRARGYTVTDSGITVVAKGIRVPA